MGIGAEGTIKSTLSGRVSIKFGRFREVIEVGKLLSLDLLKLTWTPAEISWGLMPTVYLDTAAMAGGMAFDLSLGEAGGGMFGWFTDWLNADDRAHEKVQALKKEGVLDLLDTDMKISLLSSLDDWYTGDAHEQSMADLYLSNPRGLPFIDFAERYFEKDRGKKPPEKSRYKSLMDHIKDSVIDDNKAACQDVQSELKNSSWVLEPDDFLKPRFRNDYSIPGGHEEHWGKKARRDGRYKEFRSWGG
jgi:hypothetical protein